MMKIYEIPCWKCKKPYKVAICDDDIEGTYSAMDFNEHEIQVASENGVIIKEHFSKTIQQNYLASTCGNCGAFCGDFFACCEIWHEYENSLIKNIDIPERFLDGDDEEEE